MGGVGVGDLAVHLAGDVGAQRLHRSEQVATRRARLLVGDLLGPSAITGGHGVAHRLVGGEVAVQLCAGRAIEFTLLGQRRQRRVRGQLVMHGLGGVVHALVVVGDLLRLVEHAQLCKFIGAEFPQLRARLAQVLDRGDVVASHLAQLRVGFAQAQQCEGAEDQGHQGGEGEPHGQLAGDGQILEPLHAGCSRWAECRRLCAGSGVVAERTGVPGGVR